MSNTEENLPTIRFNQYTVLHDVATHQQYVFPSGSSAHYETIDVPGADAYYRLTAMADGLCKVRRTDEFISEFFGTCIAFYTESIETGVVTIV